VQHQPKFGIFLPCYAFKTQKTGTQLFNKLLETAQTCQQYGFDSVWIDDHLMLNNMQTLECWTTLTALATHTKKIRLGTMVTCNNFRNPALLAKMAATVDNISNGRLELGIGAGVQESEHTAYGFDFPSAKTRIKRLNEAAQIIKKLWTKEKVSFNGKHYTTKDAVCKPKPIQKPHPPLVIGGAGEKQTLKVTAQHATRFDFGYLPTVNEYKHKLSVLEKHCKTVGRNFDEIEKSCWPMGQTFLREKQKQLEKNIPNWVPKGASPKDFVKSNFVGTPKECVKQIQQYANLGATHYMVFFGDLPDLTGLELFAKQVVPNIKLTV
jgi:F420-dependent oxidoreductase-like protein